MICKFSNPISVKQGEIVKVNNDHIRDLKARVGAVRVMSYERVGVRG